MFNQLFLSTYHISSDFSNLPDITGEYIDLSIFTLAGSSLYVLYLISIYTGMNVKGVNTSLILYYRFIEEYI